MLFHLTMVICLVFVAYVAGGVPFAFLLARQLSGKDVRYAGSGNIGAANVLRTVGTLASIAVLVLDVGKGYFMVLLARVLGMDEASAAAVAGAVVVGHIFPVWLKFRGGKGVATAFGAFVLLAPVATLFAAVVLFLVAGFTRYVSLGSILAALLLPPLTYLTQESVSVVLSASVVALVVILRHRSNIQRLLTGDERRLGDRSA